MTGSTLEDELSSVLECLTQRNYTHSMVLEDPDGKVQYISSHEPDESILNTLRQCVVGNAQHTPESKYTTTTLHDTTVFTDHHGVLLHRAVDSPTFPLDVSDIERVQSHLRTCLRELQQLACKAIAKAWIKVVEPRKQTRHPYKDGDASKPGWWPRGIRHVEPDHLHTKERVALMVELALRANRSVEALWRAARGVKELTAYQYALIDEVMFVARAYRVQEVKQVVVSDWDNCSRGRYTKQKLYKVQKEEVEDKGSDTSNRKAKQDFEEQVQGNMGHRRVVSQNDLTGSSADMDYVNPVVSFHQDLRKMSMTEMHTSVGSLALHPVSKEDRR